MKTQTLTAQYKETEFTFTAQVPENPDEFAQITGVPLLDFGNRQYLRRLTGNLKNKVAQGKIKPTDQKALTKAAAAYKLVLPGGPAKKQLRTLFKDMSETEAAVAAEAIAKLRKKEAADTPANNE